MQTSGLVAARAVRHVWGRKMKPVMYRLALLVVVMPSILILVMVKLADEPPSAVTAFARAGSVVTVNDRYSEAATRSGMEPPAGWRLEGTIVTAVPNDGVAVLRLTDQTLRRVSRGETLEGWTLLRVASQEIELGMMQHRHIIRVAAEAAPDRPPQAQLPVRPPGYPGPIVIGTPGTD